jgi:hypothetical protein
VIKLTKAQNLAMQVLKARDGMVYCGPDTFRQKTASSLVGLGLAQWAPSANPYHRIELTEAGKAYPTP